MEQDKCTICAECGEDLNIGETYDLIKTYEVDEGAPDYPSIFEQLWHRECYRIYANRQHEAQRASEQ